MGYNTSFRGSAKVTCEPTLALLSELKDVVMNNDGNENLSWNFDIEHSDTEISIEWRGEEKTYEFEDGLNAIINSMRERGFEDFDLEGKFSFHGEESGDFGLIDKVDGEYVRIPYTEIDIDCECPDCKKKFTVRMPDVDELI